LLDRTSIDVESFYGNIDLSVSISRCQFEQMCSDLFRGMLAIADKALSDAKLDKTDGYEVNQRYFLQDAISGSKLIKFINPDEAAGCGAALLASDMINKQSLKFLEVAPISLHLATPGGVVKTLIERNMKIPTKKTEDILLRMYRSKQALTNDDNLVGEFHLLGIQSSLRKCPRIKVTYAIDENGILNAWHCGKKTIQIEYVGRLLREEIEQMINGSESLGQENEKQQSKMATRSKLESCIFTIHSKSEDNQMRQNIRALAMCAAMLKWMDTDQVATRKVYEQMLKKVERVCNPIMAAKKDGS
uniref:SEC63 domain-containing protein n=1 Tax=Taenia asiatica TaxID=60517 RepID=A0A0R3WGF9_TAEAS